MADENNNENNEVVETNNEVETTTENQPSTDELLSKLAKMEADLKAAQAEAKKHRKEKTAVKSEVEKTNETIETVRTQLTEELTTAQQRHAALLDRLKMDQVNAQVKSALEEAKCLSPKLMSREVLDRIESTFDEETGKVSVVVKDADGNPMFVKGKEATLADLVKALREDAELAHAFEGVQEGGTGAKAPTDLKGKDAVENPWKTGNTELQHKMWKDNPTQAKKMRDEVRGATKTTWARL